MSILEKILADARHELADARAKRPPVEIRGMLGDAPPARDFAGALRSADGLALIAEFKRRSPSVGPMRLENVSEAVEAYAECDCVRAVSVLTNGTHFEGSIEELLRVRDKAGKPVLRKDFLFDDYQIREARAFGADAVLLMACVLEPARLLGLWELACELGMDALVEIHDEQELAHIPAGARLVGINSRRFRDGDGFSGARNFSEEDFTLHMEAFDLVERLPERVVKVAESGLNPRNLHLVAWRFDAILVGTSLLRDKRGVRACLRDFEEAISTLAG